MPLEPIATTPPAATPPATPTPAPASPPPAATPPAAAPAPEPVASPFNEVFDRAEAHIKKMDEGSPGVAHKPEPKPEPKPEVKPDAAPKGQKPADKPKSEPHKLRDELDARTAELTAVRDSESKLQAKLKELETKGQDTEKVLARISQMEKERGEIVKERDGLSAKLKVVKLEEDPEFQKEYDQKFNRYAALTKDFVEKVDVLGQTSQQDGEGNPVIGPIRKADWNRDFVKIYHQYKDSPLAAFSEMKRLFGDDAARLVLPKIESLVEMERNREEKLAESRLRAKDMEVQEQAQAATRRQQLESLWVTTNREIQERNPDFKIDPTDTELTQVRDESLRIFDGKPANDQQRLVKNAHIRQMVGSFAVQKVQLAKANKRISELSSELESLKNPTPPPSKRTLGGSPAGEPEEDWAVRAKRELA